METVRTIFQFACDGLGYKAICRHLRDKGYLNPNAYANLKDPEHHAKSDYWEEPHDWHATSIKTMLHNPTYLGKVVSGRQTTRSYEQFMGMIAAYKDITALNASILNELVQSIEVGPIRMEDGVKHRSIRIRYRQYCYVEIFTEDELFGSWDEATWDAWRQIDAEFDKRDAQMEPPSVTYIIKQESADTEQAEVCACGENMTVPARRTVV